MPVGLPRPLGDVSHVIDSCPGERVFIKDNEILSVICILQKSCGASILQQLTAYHPLVSVKPWNTHTGQKRVYTGCGGNTLVMGVRGWLGASSTPGQSTPQPTTASLSPGGSCDVIPSINRYSWHIYYVPKERDHSYLVDP